MRLDEINIRDPFIVADYSARKYYMYSSSPACLPKGFCVYVSDDLKNWSNPVSVFEATADFWATDDFWAPEVHEYKGSFYLFGTFSAENRTRTSQILKSDSLTGPFSVYSQPLAPDDWYALDATLLEENGRPYAVFSHEWLQTGDGEMCCVRLSDDLKKPVGEVRVLFRASESGWARNPVWNKCDKPVYIVDAPFVYDINGVKFMLWSSWSSEDKDGYDVGVAYPKGGFSCGEYAHKLLNLPKKDSGHAMVFKDFNGDFRIALHENNSVHGMERAAIYYISVKNGEVFVYETKENN